MNITQSYKVLKNIPVKKAIMLKGVHGIGKTEVIRQISKEIWNLPCVELQGSQLSDVGDLVGLQKLGKDGGTYWEPPYWYPRNGKPVCLFLDELNRADAPIKRALMQLGNDKQVLDMRLPLGSRVVVAMNPGEDGNYDVMEMDFAELSRFVIYDFEPTVEEGLNHFRKVGVHFSKGENSERFKEVTAHPAVIGFIEENPSLFDPPKKIDASHYGRVLPCRRSWFGVSEVLWNMEWGGDMDLDVLTITLAGYIGMENALMFRTHYSSFESGLTAKELLETKNFKKVKDSLEDFMKKGKVEMLRFAKGISLYLKENDTDLGRKTEKVEYQKLVAKNLYNFFDFLTPELKVSVYSEVVKQAQTEGLKWERSLHIAEPKLKEMYIKIISIDTQM